MNHSDFVKSFLEMEEANDLFSYQIKGHVVWDYIRYAAFSSLSKAALRPDQISFSKKSKWKGYIFELFATPLKALYFLYRYYWGGAYDILIIGYARKNHLDNKYVNISFYPLIESLNAKYRILYLDPTVLVENVEKNYKCDVLRSRILAFLSHLGIGNPSLSHGDRQILNEIVEKISNWFAAPVETSRWLFGFFNRQYSEYIIYRRLFKKCRPKIIFHADTGNNKGWIEAAKELSIPVVDFQHSLMSQNNILYTYPKLIGDRKLRTLSDYIFTFGSYWNKQYSLPVKRISVGFPYLEMKKAEINGTIKRNANSIIIISSMHSGKQLQKIAIELARTLPSYQIIYKLRSEEYRRWREICSVDFKECENIHVIENDDVSLYELFAGSSYQIGINSTALIEGMAFGLMTFIVKHGWYAEMSSLIKDGCVQLVESAAEIVSIIAGDVQTDRIATEEGLFKKHSLANIEREVAYMLGE